MLAVSGSGVSRSSVATRGSARANPTSQSERARLHGEIRADRPLLVVALEIEAQRLHVHRLPILVTGLGKVNAAASLAVALAGARPSLVVNLGTAGALRPDLIGPHEVTHVRQHDLDSAAIERLTGIWPGGDLTTDAPEGTPPTGLSTGDSFVADPDHAAALAEVSSLVDMEGYSVARVAAAFELPVRLIKTVSDGANEDAVRDWQSTVAACAAELGNWVHQNLYHDAWATVGPSTDPELIEPTT
ncbi:MAG: adenosylhomocysteine nucleosidase [Actinomycetota bacterium]|nr:adenosylhomocysteine nucleosidase [Actinomycetota bacterium]